MLVGLLAGCSLDPERTGSASPDWSRGRLVGSASLDNPPALQPDAAGRVHLVWVSGSDQDQTLQYARLDSAVSAPLSHPLALNVDGPQSPLLLPAGPDSFHLVFQAHAPGLQPTERGLYYARLSTAGEMLSAPQLLSGPGSPVAQVRSLPDVDGGVDLFWSSTDGSDLSYAQLDASGRLVGREALPLAPARFTVDRDRDGRMLVAWIQPGEDQDGAVVVGVWDKPAALISSAVRVARFTWLRGTVVDGPYLGLDDTHTYIFWTHDQRRGAQTTHGTDDQSTASIMYVLFPTAEPAESAPQLLSVPTGLKPIYQPYAGGVYVALASGEGPPSDYVVDFNLVRGRGGELVGFFSADFKLKQRGRLQVGTVVFAHGRIAGYQQIDQTSTASHTPVAALRPDGRLDLVWLERASEDHDDLRYASTDPDAITSLQSLTAQDMALGVVALFFAELSALALAPLALVWVALPLMLLVSTALVAPDISLDERRGRVLLLVLLAAHWLVKLATLPPAPPGTPLPTVLATLGAALALALLALALYWRNPLHRSLFAAYFIFMAVDVMATLFLYLPLVVN